MVVKQSCLSMVKQLGTIVVVKQSSLSNYGGKKGLAEPIVMVKQSSLSIVMAKQSSLSIVMAKQADKGLEVFTNQRKSGRNLLKI